MKYLRLISVALTLFISISLSHAQSMYMIEWVDTVDNGDDDRSNSIAIDSIGNVYVTGYTVLADGYKSYLTLKYDTVGNILWADTIKRPGDHIAFDITVDVWNNIYVTGEGRCPSLDYLTIKYDSNGNIIREDTLDVNYNNDYSRGIIVDTSGNIYITGYTYSGGDYKYLTVKYDSFGNVLWLDTLNLDDLDIAHSIDVDVYGNVYITGATTVESVKGHAVGATVKYDSLGNLQWVDTLLIGGIGSSYDVAVSKISDGLYVAGRSYIDGKNEYVTVKYDFSGNIMWVDTFDTGIGGEATSITTDGKGNVYITGRAIINSMDNFLTVKYDSAGRILWADTMRAGGGAEGIAVDGNGNIYVTGYFYNGTDYDFLTIKYKKLKDAGIFSIVSPNETGLDSTYIPKIEVVNNSCEDTLSMDIMASIDSLNNPLYSSIVSVGSISPGETLIVEFSPWTAPSHPETLKLSFSFINYSDMIQTNDTMTQDLYVIDYTFPVIDSAIAHEGADTITGIDGDDYVVLYFSEPTNRPVINASNIDDVLTLSGMHSWLDGSNSIGECIWSPEGDRLVINLTVNTIAPSINVGDTIRPDSITITDVNGNACYSPIVLVGTFGPPFRDMAIIGIPSPDTVETDSIYTPQVWISNFSDVDTLSIEVESRIDYAGTNFYLDTVTVEYLSPGDSALLSFSHWYAPSNPMDLILSFSLIGNDMNALNDSISKTLYVRTTSYVQDYTHEGITDFRVSKVSNGEILITYTGSGLKEDVKVTIYNLEGREIKSVNLGKVKSNTLRVFGIKKGVYFIRLTSGKQVFKTRTIVIE